jgi:hypothetical protein
LFPSFPVNNTFRSQSAVSCRRLPLGSLSEGNHRQCRAFHFTLKLPQAHSPPNFLFSITTNSFFSTSDHPLSLSVNNITHPPMDAITLS